MKSPTPPHAWVLSFAAFFAAFADSVCALTNSFCIASAAFAACFSVTPGIFATSF
jgi:hypothetical protein